MAESHRTGLPLTRREKPQPDQQGMDQGVSALSYLISGVLIWGLLGFLGDHLLGTHFLIPIGVVIGAGLGCYMIIMRFGGLGLREQSDRSAASQATTDERG